MFLTVSEEATTKVQKSHPLTDKQMYDCLHSDHLTEKLSSMYAGGSIAYKHYISVNPPCPKGPN